MYTLLSSVLFPPTVCEGIPRVTDTISMNVMLNNIHYRLTSQQRLMSNKFCSTLLLLCLFLV